MNFKKLTIVVLLSTPIFSWGQSRIYVNEYLNIGVGARGLGMGGAQSASSGDVYSTYWNPAGMINIKGNGELGYMHSEYFGSIFKYDFGAAAFKLKDKKRALGISFIRFATDNIPYTLDYVQPDGSFDESKLKGFSAADYAFTISYAQQLGWFKNKKGFSASFGANAKLIYRNVGTMANAMGAGADLGLQIKAKQWRFGIMAKDITTTRTSWVFNLTPQQKETFSKTGNEIPIKSFEVMNPRINFGIAKQFLKPKKDVQVLAEIGFDMTTDGKRMSLYSTKNISIDPRMGIETSYKNTIFLRGGISNMYNALDNADTNNVTKYFVFQPAIGLGFKIKQLHIDYAFTSLNMQDNPLYSHIISAKINLKSKKKSLAPENKVVEDKSRMKTKQSIQTIK